MLRPNIMWFWGAITLAIFGYYIFGNKEAEPVKTDWNTVEQMVAKGDVERITVVNRDVARVAIKESKIDSLRESNLRYKNLPQKGYQFFYNIGSVDTFREDIAKAEADGNGKVVIDYEKEEPWYDSWLVGLLPWILMLGIWFLLMRGMRGGGAGGGHLRA